jgi:hypothetical protein
MSSEGHVSHLLLAERGRGDGRATAPYSWSHWYTSVSTFATAV